MQDIGSPTVLHDERHGSSKPGPIPWVIGFLSLITLGWFIPKQLSAINQDVDFGVRSLLATSDAKNIDVDIDGRDVTFTGKVTPKFERDWFMQSVAELSQIRVVRDNLSEHDPREEARRVRADFQNLIRAIDTSAISFEPASAEFSAGSEQTLLQLVDLLKKYPERRVKVAGHTDASGSRESNLALSRDRATAITGFLEDRGIPRKQLLASGYGSNQPIASNETEDGRARNRRIDLIVMN